MDPVDIPFSASGGFDFVVPPTVTWTWTWSAALVLPSKVAVISKVPCLHGFVSLHAIPPTSRAASKPIRERISPLP
jgi:hypothetical protein